MKTKKKPQHFSLTFMFAAIVFIILTITMVFVVGITLILSQAGVFDLNLSLRNMALPFAVIALISILIGTIVAAVFGGIPVRPFSKLIKGLDTLSSGDYDVKLDLGTTSVEKRMSDSFNSLANELRCTEMLRSDFVNNFSHEFKTPIVSISGFARLIKKGNISEEQKNEYLEIILDESTRL
ncbi:MAG: sensor histidine kinase, partial [Clostridiales bacterium]|nr:sensor histidine kinase [Clostridiales bacterium]